MSKRERDFEEKQAIKERLQKQTTEQLLERLKEGHVSSWARKVVEGILKERGIII
ncbi:hypothetical protein [Flavisolibacter ginsenosidimutans]|uniref:hypothetical protein n=1 Tax=Flavisolibacter ginsenosidimutans TaxID=661481 RepID=UPI00155ABB51|nr:hypothetical protein [Flavisolibacter ginsenosidimutans]